VTDCARRAAARDSSGNTGRPAQGVSRRGPNLVPLYLTSRTPMAGTKYAVLLMTLVSTFSLPAIGSPSCPQSQGGPLGVVEAEVEGK
jgi:hypothetical protein